MATFRLLEGKEKTTAMLRLRVGDLEARPDLPMTFSEWTNSRRQEEQRLREGDPGIEALGLSPESLQKLRIRGMRTIRSVRDLLASGGRLKGTGVTRMEEIRNKYGEFARIQLGE